MAIKSANVTARVEPEIKDKAEEILEHLGIPASVAINMFYRQVIYWNGLPFRPVLPDHKPAAVSEMTKEEFDARMAEGLRQAKNGESSSADDVQKRIIDKLNGLD